MPLRLDGRRAGAIFLGRHAPEAVGDGLAGPDQVASTALAAIGSAAATLARTEGLDAHAPSLTIRVDAGSDRGGAP